MYLILPTEKLVFTASDVEAPEMHGNEAIRGDKVELEAPEQCNDRVELEAPK
jgi:hypothetical protein